MFRICNLREDQIQKLEATFIRYRSQVQKDASALEEDALRNPRMEGEEAREFDRRLTELNGMIHQSFFTAGSLTEKVLRSQLDDEQLYELQRANLSSFVESLASSDLEWSERQSEQIRSHLEQLLSQHPSAVLDPQILLDELDSEFLTQVLDAQQIRQFESLLRTSSKVHFLLLNVDNS
ncbi:MAG: hypothetical protein KDB03_13665 [Planctomycetales bacterium]|nr:hypothetical protein [Planctomycetales bacterium]